MKRNMLCAAILGIGAWLAGAPAQATTYSYSWDFTCSSGCTSSGSGNGNTRSTTDSSSVPSGGPSVTATASAWSDTSSSSPRSIETAYLGSYSGGLGVTNRDAASGEDGGEGGSPEHSMDNNGRYDAILFDFGTSIALGSIRLGWTSNDSDISLLAYTSTTQPYAAPGGFTFAQLDDNDGAGKGWEVIGNYADLSTSTRAVNASNKESRYWLITAYNSTFSSAGCTDFSGSTNSNGCTNGSSSSNHDYVKIATLGGTHSPGTPPPPPPPGVPEPGSLALVGVAMLGVLAARRRRG